MRRGRVGYTTWKPYLRPGPTLELRTSLVRQHRISPKGMGTGRLCPCLRTAGIRVIRPVPEIIECRRTSVARMIATLVLALALLACRDKLHIEKIAEPEYPLRARYEKLQGTITVRVEIGADGKVTFAEGSGAPEILV